MHTLSSLVSVVAGRTMNGLQALSLLFLAVHRRQAINLEARSNWKPCRLRSLSAALESDCKDANALASDAAAIANALLRDRAIDVAMRRRCGTAPAI